MDQQELLLVHQQELIYEHQLIDGAARRRRPGVPPLVVGWAHPTTRCTVPQGIVLVTFCHVLSCHIL